MMLPHAALRCQLKCHVTVMVWFINDVNQRWCHAGLTSGIFAMATGAILVEKLLALSLRCGQYGHIDLNEWFAGDIRFVWS